MIIFMETSEQVPDGEESKPSVGRSTKPPVRRGFALWLVVRRMSFLAVVLVGAGLIARWIWFQGPYKPVEPLPVSPIWDLHCHTAGIGAGDSGCFVSPALRANPRFRIYLRAFGVTVEELETYGDSLLVDRLAALLADSEHVRGAVLLALDGRMTPEGALDRQQTEIHIPNEFVAREVGKHTNLLFGASIHPGRVDALDRLDWAAENGAVLVKWIPSIMGIDPSNEAYRPFYQRMIDHGLPLLTHTGQERSFTLADDTLADPMRLKLPLEMGVTVIAAHVASTGVNEGEKDMDRLARLMADYPKLFTEISSLTQANKLGYLRRALESKEFEGRLLYGSDFPLINTAIVSPWFFPLNLSREEMARVDAIENPWDRDVALKQALGVPREIFQKTWEIIEKRQGPDAAR